MESQDFKEMFALLQAIPPIAQSPFQHQTLSLTAFGPTSFHGTQLEHGAPQQPMETEFLAH